MCRVRLRTQTPARHLINASRNQFAERLFSIVAKNIRIKCRYNLGGPRTLDTASCTVYDLVDKVNDHEQICVYRTVQCPAHHNRTCTWSGPLSQMILHAMNNKCAQASPSYISYSCSIIQSNNATCILGFFADCEVTRVWSALQVMPRRLQ